MNNPNSFSFTESYDFSEVIVIRAPAGNPVVTDGTTGVPEGVEDRGSTAEKAIVKTILSPDPVENGTK